MSLVDEHPPSPPAWGPPDPPGPRRTGLRPSRRVALVLGALAVATIALRLPSALVVVVLAAIVGSVAVDLALAARSRPRLRRSQLPTLARQTRHPLVVSVDIEGTPGTSTRSLRVRQPAPPELAVTPPEVNGPVLDAFVVGRHRGVHSLPPVIDRVSGPLGLGTCDHVLGEASPVTVVPDLPRARRLAAARRRQRSVEEGQATLRLGLGTEFDSIREYSPDDDIRQVNWLATARVGRAMTNQYRIDDNRELLCLVDTGRLMASPLGGTATRLDAALDAVAVLAVAADEAGDRVGTVAFAGDILRRLEPRRRGAAHVVNALFDLEPVEVESDYERAFQGVAGRKRCLIALFTDLVDPAAARTLLAVVPLLTRRHAVIVATARDPDLDTMVSRPPSDVRDVLTATVSIDLLAARRRTAAVLRRYGASVVEADPESLGPACVRTYAGLKSAGRL